MWSRMWASVDEPGLYHVRKLLVPYIGYLHMYRERTKARGQEVRKGRLVPELPSTTGQASPITQLSLPLPNSQTGPGRRKVSVEDRGIPHGRAVPEEARSRGPQPPPPAPRLGTTATWAGQVTFPRSPHTSRWRQVFPSDRTAWTGRPKVASLFEWS